MKRAVVPSVVRPSVVRRFVVSSSAVRPSLVFLSLLFVAVMVASCGLDRDAGERFRAERELWQANWEYQRLSVRPQDVTESQWTALAQKYEAIAGRHPKGSVAAGGGEQQTIQTVAARALFTAAQVYGTLRDSTRVDQIFQQMAQDYGQLPTVAAEVALARGRIAESRRQFTDAADFYQTVVDRVEPKPEAAGVAGMVLELPLLVARLRTQAAKGVSAAMYYAPVQAYYERMVRENPGNMIQFASQGKLAEIAADEGDWRKATRALRDLEAQLRQLDSPPRDPADVRFAIAGVLNRTGVSPDSVHAALASVLTDYPKAAILPRVLQALAVNADQRDKVEEALGYLDRIVTENKEAIDDGSKALLTRGRILEKRDRWQEALSTFRTIPTQYPLTEAALTAPLEIAGHYARLKDKPAETTALGQAERDYRDFLTKYPPGPMSIFARAQLVQTLILQKNLDAAVTEMVALGEAMGGSPRSASIFLGAAQMAFTELSDTLRACTILDRVGKLYASAEVGKWASTEATRLRGTMSR